VEEDPLVASVVEGQYLVEASEHLVEQVVDLAEELRFVGVNQYLVAVLEVAVEAVAAVVTAGLFADLSYLVGA
jgi:hypothetical protein